MCGIAAILGKGWTLVELQSMVDTQRHRGPDAEGLYIDPTHAAGLGHNRLSIIDLSDAGKQPMFSADGSLVITYNGEIYNYLELRRELESSYQFRTRTDTEVLLAAYEKWGSGCLDRLLGMFAFVIWDVKNQTAFAARDRFGVKPLHYYQKPNGALIVASEIKSIHATGVPRTPDPIAWSTYLDSGLHDHSDRTFWQGVRSLPPGHFLEWTDGSVSTKCWYDIAARSGDAVDQRPESVVAEEYLSLLRESVAFRFRSDVPAGVNLSGGLDSSVLLGLIHEVQGPDSDVKAFTFETGDPRYDETPWVEKMLDHTSHRLVTCRLDIKDVPSLAASIQIHQDAPFGGLPTVAYSNVFRIARENGVTVLLDGNGMDEQWAGYDYYREESTERSPRLIQGTRESPVKPECLDADFRKLAEPMSATDAFPDNLRNTQYRDIRYTKIPRAMRFNDRISMLHSTELREPFLDHRLFELALRQRPERKIKNGVGKVMLRDISKRLVPSRITQAPKRPLQTPQREWLRGGLRDWSHEKVESALTGFSSQWLNPVRVRSALTNFYSGSGDNSYYIWQWLNLGLMNEAESHNPQRQAASAIR